MLQYCERGRDGCLELLVGQLSGVRGRRVSGFQGFQLGESVERALPGGGIVGKRSWESRSIAVGVGGSGLSAGKGQQSAGEVDARSLAAAADSTDAAVGVAV